MQATSPRWRSIGSESPCDGFWLGSSRIWTLCAAVEEAILVVLSRTLSYDTKNTRDG